MFGGNAPAPDDVAAVAAWEAEHCDDRIVVMADVWLDRPDTFDKLHAVLSGRALREFSNMSGSGLPQWRSHQPSPGSHHACLRLAQRCGTQLSPWSLQPDCVY